MEHAPPPTSKGPRRLSDLLGQVCARLGLARDLDDYRIWQAWDDVVGPLVARNAQPVRLDGRRLIVAVRSTTWMQELSLLRRDLCGRLNAWMKREVITEILLVIGKVDLARPTDPRAGGGRYGTAGPPSARSLHSRTRDQLQPEPAEQTRARLEAAIEKLWAAARRRGES